MNEKKHLQVVAAVIRHDGRYLCMQRGATRYAYTSNKWEFPGGKIEQGETAQQALRREICEELSMDIVVGDPLTTVIHEYPDFRITMQAFLCHATDPRFRLNEHKAFCWSAPDEMAQLDWAAADLPIVRAVQENDK